VYYEPIPILLGCQKQIKCQQQPFSVFVGYKCNIFTQTIAGQQVVNRSENLAKSSLTKIYGHSYYGMLIGTATRFEQQNDLLIQTRCRPNGT